MEKVIVEFLRFEKGGQSCSRCQDSTEVVRRVVKKMGPPLKNVKVDLELKETALKEDQMALSNSVLINGMDIMELLGEGDPATTLCPSCSELCGKDTNCRTFRFQGKESDCVTEEMLEAAIVNAASTPNVSLTAPDAVKGVCDCQPGCQPPDHIG